MKAKYIKKRSTVLKVINDTVHLIGFKSKGADERNEGLLLEIFEGKIDKDGVDRLSEHFINFQR